MKLTLNETRALFYNTEYPHLINTPVLKRALASGTKKMENHMYTLRSEEVFNMGVSAAKKGKSAVPSDMGCLEQITWYDGYCSIRKDVKNPYRS